MADWEALHEYLQPIEPQYCPEEPSLTQKVFLMSDQTEALFGGAAGGGKSSALLMAALQYVDIPNYTAILFRKTFADLALPGALMDRFKSWTAGIDEIHWNANTNTASFPSGARITFGYLNNKNDYLRYKCSTPDTEVLTEDGWKPISNIVAGERVFSMDPGTRVGSFEAVAETYEYDYDGEIVVTRPGSDVSFAVTPNHTVWRSTQKSNRLTPSFAKDLPQRPHLPQVAKWSGIAPTEVRFLAGTHGNNLKFSPIDWAEFLGWYLSEGDSGSYGGRWQVRISQTKKYPQHRLRIQKLLERSGANVHVDNQSLSLNNKALCQYLDKLGSSAKTKHVPFGVFKWDSEHAFALLDSLMEGDGTWRDVDQKGGHFVTTSPQLADDMMRLATMCGYRATHNIQPYNEKHHFVSEGESHHVSILHKPSDTATWVERRDYSGKVHGLNVPPHHTYMIRHNGRISFTGNSAEFQFIGMDEVTEIREEDYRYLFSRLRRPKSGPLSRVPLRMRAASNPAPNWVRQRFIIEDQEGRVFVQSFLEDNPGVDHASYRSMLQELTPVERAQLADGEWFVASEGDLFKKENFEIIEPGEMPTMLAPKVVRWWDLAGTKVSSQNKDPDWTVGALLAFDRGFVYVLDVKSCREESPKVEALIAETAAEDGVGVPVRMEREPGSSGKSLANMYSRNIIAGFDFAAIPSTGDKITRARPFASAVSNGNVKLVQGPWITRYLDELVAFHSEKGSATGHDDQVDASSSAYSFITGISGMQRRKVSIVV